MSRAISTRQMSGRGSTPQDSHGGASDDHDSTNTNAGGPGALYGPVSIRSRQGVLAACARVGTQGASSKVHSTSNCPALLLGSGTRSAGVNTSSGTTRKPMESAAVSRFCPGGAVRCSQPCRKSRSPMNLLEIHLMSTAAEANFTQRWSCASHHHQAPRESTRIGCLGLLENSRMRSSRFGCFRPARQIRSSRCSWLCGIIRPSALHRARPRAVALDRGNRRQAEIHPPRHTLPPGAERTRSPSPPPRP